MTSKPLVDGFNWLGNLTLRPFGVRPITEGGSNPHTGAELRMLLRESAEVGTIGQIESDLADRVMVISTRRARDLMVPFSDMKWLPDTASMNDAASAVVESGHSRIPLLDEFQHPAGLVASIDVLKKLSENQASASIEDIKRPIEIVPEAARALDILNQLRTKRQRIAIVADEYGSVTGIVGIEDVVEELVGELYDEFDTNIDTDDPRRVKAAADGSVLVPGDFPVRGLEKFDIDVPEGDYTTVSGLVTDRLQRIAEVGDSVEIPGWNITVRSVGRSVVELVDFKKPQE